MHLNTDPVPPLGKPCLRDLSTLVATLLPPNLVMLSPLAELERRCQEINATHPHYREETPLVLAYEQRRRRQPTGAFHVSFSLPFVQQHG